MITPELVEDIQGSFPFRVFEAGKNDPKSLRSLEAIAKALRVDLFQFFEPSFFGGKLYVFKQFNDDFVFPENEGSLVIYDDFLLDRYSGNLFIQVFKQGQYYFWEDRDPSSLIGREDLLTYFYEANREFFLIGDETIEFTQYPYGSMFAPQFFFLDKAIHDFGNEKIKNSSCMFFSKAWHRPLKDEEKGERYDNRILFHGGGRGSGIPEKHMQDSLENFLKSDSYFRNIDIEVNREFNLNSEKPKPVDFRVTWLEANRTALLELKWTGSSISEEEALTTHGDRRVNDGLEQLKGYWEGARHDLPKKLIKAFLLVFDGRRNGITKDSVEISFLDGLHFKNISFEIEDNRKYFDEIVGFEPPIRIFAEPKCKIA